MSDDAINNDPYAKKLPTFWYMPDGGAGAVVFSSLEDLLPAIRNVSWGHAPIAIEMELCNCWFNSRGFCLNLSGYCDLKQWKVDVIAPVELQPEDMECDQWHMVDLPGVEFFDEDGKHLSLEGERKGDWSIFEHACFMFVQEDSMPEQMANLFGKKYINIMPDAVMIPLSEITDNSK